MQNQLNCHYSPALCNLSGTYRVNCGSVFYIGSAARLGARNSEHRTTLEKGKHPNKKLQAAYTSCGQYLFTVLTEIPRVDDSEHKARLRAAEQLLLDAHAGDPCLANFSTSSTHNSGIGAWLASRWEDPGFRDSQIERLKAQKGRRVTKATRNLMSEAKKGARNHSARPCLIHFLGVTRRFETVSEAAAYFKVTQQTMDLWIRGVVPWPGTGSRKPKHWSLIGMTGELI